MRSCDGCKHCGVMVNGDRQILKICRFRPPVVTAVPMQGPNGQLGWASTTAWPAVGDADWCGEWAPKVAT